MVAVAKIIVFTLCEVGLLHSCGSCACAGGGRRGVLAGGASKTTTPRCAAGTAHRAVPQRPPIAVASSYRHSDRRIRRRPLHVQQVAAAAAHMPPVRHKTTTRGG